MTIDEIRARLFELDLPEAQEAIETLLAKLAAAALATPPATSEEVADLRRRLAEVEADRRLLIEAQRKTIAERDAALAGRKP